MGATITIIGCVLNCLAEEAIAITTGLWGCSYGFSHALRSFLLEISHPERIFNPLLFCGWITGYSGNPKKIISKMEDAMTFLREQGMQLHVNCNACHYSTETR